MLTLALETSLVSGSVALSDAAGLRREIFLPPEQRSAQALAPAVAQLLADEKIGRGEIALIAVTAGPGSFTGLRVGVMTAKTLAFAWKCAVLGVNTLEVLARQVSDLQTLPPGTRLHAVMDAQRRQLFAGRWSVSSDGSLQTDVAVQLIDRTAFLAELRPGDLVTGPGLGPLVAQLPPEVIAADEAVWTPRASMVGRIAVEAFARGERDDWRTLVPLYLRPSAAEEKRAARETA